jgi:hypothetical protein
LPALRAYYSDRFSSGAYFYVHRNMNSCVHRNMKSRLTALMPVPIDLGARTMRLNPT